MNGIAVIIRHGNYLSVYSNLSTVFVKVGDKVNLNQPIGKIETKGSTNSILHFEIWNEKSPENPLLWIN
jgi:murein DD-endopeptidase MepM/ murein hydrolase activator NlpD